MKLDKNDYILYLIAGVTALPYFFIDIKSLLIIHLVYISLIIIRFFAGFGLFSLYTLFLVYLMKFTSDFFKKKKREAERFRLFLNILGILYFVGIVVYSLITLSTTVNYLSLITGIGSFIVTLYILPIWKEEKLEEGLIDKIKEKVVKGIKKGYYKYFTKEYLKAYSIEYLSFKVKLDQKRKRIAHMLTPVMILLAFPILPLILIVAYYSYKLYFYKVSFLDKLIFIAALVIIMIIQAYFMSTIVISAFIWNIPYIIGAIISFYIFISSFMM